MSTYQFEMWLTASDPTGHPVSPEGFAHALGIDLAPYTVAGLNGPWANARLDVDQIHRDDFHNQEEPDEAFHTATGDVLRGFATWLTRLTPETLDTIRTDGFQLKAVIYCWIDGNMFDLSLPPELMAELGRLKLPLQLMTEGQ